MFREVEPPRCDTGAPITPASAEAVLSVHWLRQTYTPESGLSPDEVVELVEHVCSESGGGYLETHDWGRMMYRKHHVFAPGNICVYVDPVAPNMPPVMVDVPGQGCEALGLDRIRTLAAVGKTTRADFAYDGCPISPAEWASLARAGGVRSRARTRRYVETISGDDSNTFYLGSRQSRAMLRVYDRRESESGVRVEVQLSKEAAESLHLVWGEDDDVFREIAVGMLRSLVELVDVSTGGGNISRASVLPIWDEWLGRLEKVKLWTCPRPVDCLERVETWLTEQVSAMLYTYHRAGRSVGDLLQSGRDRLRDRHRRLLQINSLSRRGLDAAPA